MANRFDNPIGNRENWIDTYVPRPLDMMTRLAQQKQGQFQGAMDDLEKTKGLLQVNADPNNVAYRDAWVAKRNKQLSDFSEKIIKEGYTPSNQAEWIRMKNEIVSDPDRSRLETYSKNYYDAYQKDRRELEKEGTFMPDRDPYPTTRSDGSQLVPFDYTGLEKQLNYNEVAKKHMGSIKASGQDREYFNTDAAGNILNIKQGYEGVGAQRLRELANEKAYQFYVDPAGRQYSSRFLKDKGFEDQLKGLSQYLYDANAEQIFGKSVKGTDLDYAPAYKAKQIANSQTTTLQSEGINNDMIPEHEKDLKFDSKGNLVVPNKGGYTEVQTVDAQGIPHTQTVYASNQEKDLDKMAKQVNYIKSIQAEQPELRGLTPKATIEAYQKARKAVSNESIPLNNISTDAAISIGKSLARNLEARPLYLMDGKGTTEPLTLDVIANKVGMSPEEIKEQLSTKGLGGYTQAGKTPGSYYLQVKDGRRIMIGADSEIGDSFKDSHAINEARKSLKTVEVPSRLPGSSFVVRPKISKNGNVSWDYLRIKRDNNGNVILKEPIDFKELRDFEKSQFEKSGYLGSQTDVMGDQEAY